MPDPVVPDPNQHTFDPALRRAHHLVNKLWNDAEVGAKLRATAREDFPELKIPLTTEDIIGDVKPLQEEIKALRAETAKMREERDTEAKALAEEKTKLNVEQTLEAARRKYNLTDEGFNKMVDRMKEKGNYTDPEGAALWVLQQTPPPPKPGPTWAPQSLNLFGSKSGEEQWRELHKDPLKYMDDQLTAFVRDPEGYTNETLGNG